MTTAAPSAPPMRRCIGSEKFGIEAHDAPFSDFNPQPSQKDGYARMCKTDWSRYTRALRNRAEDLAAGKDVVARSAAIDDTEKAALIGALDSERQDMEPDLTAANEQLARSRATVARRSPKPVPAPEALPQTAAEVETPEGQQALADAATAAAEARKAAEREAARVRMANLRKARKEAAEAAKA